MSEKRDMMNIEHIMNVLAEDESKPAASMIRPAQLLKNPQGGLKPLLANAVATLRTSPQFKGVIKYDEFAAQIMIASPTPWDYASGCWSGRQWNSTDDIQAAHWLQLNGVEIPPSIAQQAVTLLACDDVIHPVKAQLESLKWDGVDRLQHFVARYFGVAETPYHSEIGRCALIAAVARIYTPGCKVDSVPILEGRQGLGKSTAIRRLFWPWFTDELADFGSKDAALQLRGAWGIEFSELDAMSRAEAGRTKAFITRTTDRFRPPYGIRVIDSPRSCVFWGTTNSDNYLKDETGGRRFWPIKATTVDVEALGEVRDQLWAEARHRFHSGESWWFTNDEIGNSAIEQQKARYVGDPWDSIVSAFISEESEVSVDQILRDAISLEKGRWGQSEQNRISRILQSLGWERFQKRTGDKRRYLYRSRKNS